MSDDYVREFMTEWFESIEGHMPLTVWSRRRPAALLGTAKSPRFLPTLRAFDMLSAPDQQLVILENSKQRIGVESVFGARTNFVRYLDYQSVYFQFAGTTTIETEYGIEVMQPGDLLTVPQGTSQRSTGSADSLRWFIFLQNPSRFITTDKDQVSETAFDVVRRGGPDWGSPSRTAPPKGRVVEQMIRWRDRSNDEYITVEREYDDLIGASSLERDRFVSGIERLRPFDCFTEITGRRGAGPKFLAGVDFALEGYNNSGEQFAFHRPLRSDEIGIQFAGSATALSEVQATAEVYPGYCGVLPCGIAHSLTGRPGSLRLVMYSNEFWDVKVSSPYYASESTFEVTSRITVPHAWHAEVAAELALVGGAR